MQITRSQLDHWTARFTAVFANLLPSFVSIRVVVKRTTGSSAVYPSCQDWIIGVVSACSSIFALILVRSCVTEQSLPFPPIFQRLFIWLHPTLPRVHNDAYRTVYVVPNTMHKLVFYQLVEIRDERTAVSHSLISNINITLGLYASKYITTVNSTRKFKHSSYRSVKLDQLM